MNPVVVRAGSALYFCSDREVTGTRFAAVALPDCNVAGAADYWELRHRRSALDSPNDLGSWEGIGHQN